jgi:Scaffold protein Nfu/NifU N terminal
LNKPQRSLKKYELNNLLFFLVLIIALGVLVSFVFRFYGNRNQSLEEESSQGVISEAVSEGSDVGLFYLGTKLVEAKHQYQSRLQIPSTDDGLVRDLFNLSGVEEITIDQKIIIVKKNGSVRWDSIKAGVRDIVQAHLHMHY